MMNDKIWFLNRCTRGGRKGKRQKDIKTGRQKDIKTESKKDKK